jgi:hypothetical protein
MAQSREQLSTQVPHSLFVSTSQQNWGLMNGNKNSRFCSTSLLSFSPLSLMLQCESEWETLFDRELWGIGN